jgi:hypothetical protein
MAARIEFRGRITSDSDPPAYGNGRLELLRFVRLVGALKAELDGLDVAL